MKGIKPHTHAERERVVAEILPLIKKKFGANLRGVAAQGSFARGDDGPYADLELIAFLERLPRGPRILPHTQGFGKVVDGMLVELVWTTAAGYIKDVKELTPYWYIAGSDRLLPLLGRRYVERLNRVASRVTDEACLKAVVAGWPEVQEETAKVLGVIARRNRDALPLLAAVMLDRYLITLALLNRRPYTTAAKMVKEARTFKVKPPAFGRLVRLVNDGCRDLPALGRAVEATFAGFEKILEGRGATLYDDHLDLRTKSRTAY
jgi:hypothetical protein